MFSHSPVHTDAYYEERVREIASWEGITTIILGDEAGVLTTERARTWIPAMKVAAGDVPLEMHFHNTTGLGTQNHIIGVESGVTIVHTAISTLANGPSMPSTETSVENMRHLGHEVAIEDRRLPAIAEHFARVAALEGYPTGTPAEYRVALYQQQLPGGMMGTLLNQLRTYGMEDRLPELLDEVAIVREEMGYPVMATPFSQLVGIQALLNVVNEKRYAMIPHENLMYLAGHFGPAPGPIDPEVLDRAFSDAHGREVQAWSPPQPTLAEIRRTYGESLSDEELLLRYLIPKEDVDAMYAAGPLQEDLIRPGESPNVRWMRDLIGRSTGRSLHARSGSVSIELSR
jgi:oxaloacetate decarboxylase alpha subunit